MRNYLVLVVLILFGVEGISQEPFLRSYGGVGSDYGKAIVECASGGYLIVGSTNSFFDSSTDVYVLRLTAEGDYMWGRNIGVANQIEWGHDVKEASDGGFYIAGISNNNMENNYDGMLLKIDSDGNLLWVKTYGGDGWDFIENMAITGDDEIILAGQKTINNNQEGWLVKTDSSGEILWEETFTGTGMVQLTGVDICENGNIVFVGYNDYIPLDNQTQLNGVLTQNGNTIWSTAFSELGKVVTKNCVCGENNQILSMATSYNEEVSKIFFSAIDGSAGNISWTKQVNWDYAGKGGAINQYDNGEILISGSLPIGFGLDELDAFLDKREVDGDYISDDFSDVFGGYGEDIIHGIIPTSDGGYTAVGQTSSFGNNTQVMVIHVGVDGEDVIDNEDFLDIATPVETDSHVEKMNIWPNPARESISIELPSHVSSPADYTVSNSVGTILMEGTFKKNGNALLDIAMLPEGIYFLSVTLTDSPESVFRQRFIKVY